MMKYYFAPMEGITGYVYRNAHHEFFPHVDKYFTPFLCPNQNRKFASKEINEILPEHNQGLRVVPQLLTKNADDFVWAAEEIRQMGYSEVNFNLGCPSGTVVAKGKGAGFLEHIPELERFLDEIFAKASISVSVKTRIGKDSPQECTALMELYNRFPIKELIIHPRIQTDFYKNHPNMDAFREALHASKAPVCYNGDLFDAGRVNAYAAEFPQVETVMLGRGLIANPNLVEKLCFQRGMDAQTLRAFHDRLYGEYQKALPGARAVLFRMKELWFYMGCLFADSDKQMKKLKKAERLGDYELAVAGLFRECPWKEDGSFRPM